ncbi:MAG: choice-of-anchor B family protein [Armatimonadetes bacterium]|nr:choice-of-anchor B family protein [Armatimonadota bacterium]
MRTPALVAALFALPFAFADGEFTSSKVKLLAHFDLTQLQARSGNTCWGYVSPSGREYALMGCSNKTAVIEVTDPTKAKLIGSVPHKDGLWSDIKVYRSAMYVSTEESGSGLQVIDLSKVDEGKVTLVKTITSPGRSHTIAVDADGGYLYTCGSRESSGTTTCFDLKDPLDPKQVGAQTITPVYQHEAQVVTYKTGKYKGRTIFFGGGEGRGLEIWDVTDKDKPSLVRRVAYPFVGYCHQGWLSADKKYFYVNDEFDESTNGIATRTLVFDVSDIDKADLVSTYSTGKPSIDHNLYTRNDFIFHANYTTGLWIFDGSESPLTPKLCGFFDTHPENDNAQFEGAWSNYPLLPSGTVLISDINRGLFIVDASEATKVAVKVLDVKAQGATGAVAGDALSEADGSGQEVSGKGEATLTFEGKCRWQVPSKLSFAVHSASKGRLDQTIELYDWSSGKWEQAATGSTAEGAADLTATGKSAGRFVEAGTKAVRARLKVKGAGAWTMKLDQAGWTANP